MNHSWMNMYDHLSCDSQGGVNPAISDSSTFAFNSEEEMAATFTGEHAAFLYARHSSPSTAQLCRSLAAMEGAEAAHVTASGMGAITSAILQICGQGDEIIASRTIYGGTYALLRHFLPRFGIHTHFVDMDQLDQVKASIHGRTKLIYAESISNPLLQVTQIPKLASIAKAAGIPLIIDNTFSPLMLQPLHLGADIVVHSLTKFINGMSDGMGGAICGKQDFIASLSDVNNGAAMLLGPALDAMRAQSIWKNLHTLHVRLEKHAQNAHFLAKQLQHKGYQVHYPGLETHPHYTRLKKMADPTFLGGGLLVLRVESREVAAQIVKAFQGDGLGYLAVSLGYFRSLYSLPSTSTSSEIDESEQQEMGLTQGMIRLSVGLDPDIEQTWQRMKTILETITHSKFDIHAA
jgi:methionine-gamma-lyase